MNIKRAVIVGIGFILQILLTFIIYMFFVEHIAIINIFYGILGFVLVLYLIKDSKNYSYTLPWIILLLLFPLVATLMYVILDKSMKKSKTLKNIVKEEEKSKKYLIQDEKIRESFKDNSRLRYISDFSKFPVTTNNDVDYYKVGEEAFEVMLEDLKKAKHFIFLEYFIINHGKMWDSILEILEEKAKEGVEVRVMYDDMGCIALLSAKYPSILKEKGIKCVPFNRMNPVAGMIMNNRDHRKILVIDGVIAYSGGINLADEYINIGSRFGHWKDNAIRVRGDAVWNYTVMFLTMWNSHQNEDKDYTKYKVESKDKDKFKGYVVPYGENPLDEDLTGEDIYLNIINQAHDYVYIFTPYLIIDTDMINALTLAAKRGVDVRLVIPGIPDKKIVYTLSESYVTPLVKGGVKVYKYTPGFVHAKVFVADDKVATVGTINMDYRSLYLHFECGCYMEDAEVIKDIKKDLTDSIAKSHLVTKKEANPNVIKGIWQAILRLFAPLM